MHKELAIKVTLLRLSYTSSLQLDLISMAVLYKLYTSTCDAHLCPPSAHFPFLCIVSEANSAPMQAKFRAFREASVMHAVSPDTISSCFASLL